MDEESESTSRGEQMEQKFRQQRREAQIERVVDALETGADAAYRASSSLTVWLFEPDRSAVIKPYVKAYVGLMAALIVGSVGIAEYAHIRDPSYFGSPTVFTNPEYIDTLIASLSGAAWTLAIVFGFAYLIHQAAWEASRERRRFRDRERKREEEQQGVQAD